MRRGMFFLRLDPEGNSGGSGGDPAAPAATPAGGGEGKQTTGGNAAESFYKEKIDTLHGELSQTRTKNKALGDELSAAKAELAGYKLAEKKSGLLSEVQAKLGDFEIPGDKLDKLQGLVKVLPDTEDLGDRIAEMVDLVKVPKSAGNGKEAFSSFKGGAPAGNASANNRPSFQPGQRLSPGQLANLTPQEHAAYLRSLQQR